LAHAHDDDDNDDDDDDNDDDDDDNNDVDEIPRSRVMVRRELTSGCEECASSRFTRQEVPPAYDVIVIITGELLFCDVTSGVPGEFADRRTVSAIRM